MIVDYLQDKREKKLQYYRERHRRCYVENPEYRAQQKERNRKYRANPDNRAREKERKSTPEYRVAKGTQTPALRH